MNDLICTELIKDKNDREVKYTLVDANDSFGGLVFTEDELRREMISGNLTVLNLRLAPNNKIIYSNKLIKTAPKEKKTASSLTIAKRVATILHTKLDKNQLNFNNTNDNIVIENKINNIHIRIELHIDSLSVKAEVKTENPIKTTKDFTSNKNKTRLKMLYRNISKYIDEITTVNNIQDIFEIATTMCDNQDEHNLNLNAVRLKVARAFDVSPQSIYKQLGENNRKKKLKHQKAKEEYLASLPSDDRVFGFELLANPDLWREPEKLEKYENN